MRNVKGSCQHVGSSKRVLHLLGIMDLLWVMVLKRYDNAVGHEFGEPFGKITLGLTQGLAAFSTVLFAGLASDYFSGNRTRPFLEAHGQGLQGS